MQDNDKPVDSLDYRGYHVDFYDDDYGQQVYTKWEGREFSFGSFNTGYKEDMKYLIDKEIDTIAEIPGFKGASLMYFDNVTHRDVKLVYRLRTIKVYLTSKAKDRNDFYTNYLSKETIDELIADSIKVLKEFNSAQK